MKVVARVTLIGIFLLVCPVLVVPSCGLRLSVDGGGCAGFTYKFELGDVEADDQVTCTDGVSLVVDPTSLELIQGSEVDYVEDLGGASFKVTNPNAASGCGCGSSFSV